MNWYLYFIIFVLLFILSFFMFLKIIRNEYPLSLNPLTGEIKESKTEKIQHVISLFITSCIISIFLSLMVYGLLYTILVKFPINEINLKKSATVYNIVSIDDQHHLKGDIFLGSGTINNVNSYVFMYKTNDNGFKKSSIDSANVTIYYDSNPRIEREKTITIKNNSYINKLFKINGTTKIFWESSNYQIYIPKGSIKEIYNIDLK